LKKEPTYSDLQEAAAVLNLKMSIKLHEFVEDCVLWSLHLHCI